MKTGKSSFIMFVGEYWIHEELLRFNGVLSQDFVRHLCLLIIPPFFTHVKSLVGLILVLNKSSSNSLKIKIISLECVYILEF